MKIKHTPGPWTLHSKVTNTTLFARVYANDESSETKRNLVIIGLEDTHPVKEHIERLHADMKLIAAAPVMFKALVAAKDLIGKIRLKKEVTTQDEWEEIENAIEKATV